MCECANKCRRFFPRNNFPLVESHLHSNVFYHLALQTNKTSKSVSLQIALMSVELNQIISDLFFFGMLKYLLSSKPFKKQDILERGHGTYH